MKTIQTTIVVDSEGKATLAVARRRDARAAPCLRDHRRRPPRRPGRSASRTYPATTSPGRSPRARRSAARTSMATTGGSADPTFVDTNVLIQAAITTAPCTAWRSRTWPHWVRPGRSCGSAARCSANTSPSCPGPRPTPPPCRRPAVTDVARFQAHFRLAEDGPAVTGHLLNLIQTVPLGGKQVHDANIVATMQAHGLRRLLTHNTTDFARFGVDHHRHSLVTSP